MEFKWPEQTGVDRRHGRRYKISAWGRAWPLEDPAHPVSGFTTDLSRTGIALIVDRAGGRVFMPGKGIHFEIELPIPPDSNADLTFEGVGTCVRVRDSVKARNECSLALHVRTARFIRREHSEQSVMGPETEQ